MIHKRIRTFNTSDTYPEQNLDNDLAQAVVARGTTIFLRGQCPQNLDDAANIESHDPVEQTHKVTGSSTSAATSATSARHRVLGWLVEAEVV